MQDPEIYLNELGVELAGYLHPDRPARLDSAYRAYVNHEIFFFSSAEARGAFVSDPLTYCGTVTDPVSQERFRPDGRSPRFDYQGRPYFFTGDDTLEEFSRNPAMYADAKRVMKREM